MRFTDVKEKLRKSYQKNTTKLLETMVGNKNLIKEIYNYTVLLKRYSENLLK